MYHAKTPGSAASNMSLSRPSVSSSAAITSLRHVLMFSVIAFDSNEILYASASMKRFACWIAHLGSRVPSPSSSQPKSRRRRRNESPLPAGLEAGLLHLLDQTQPIVVGMLMKPLEISMMSKPSRLHSSMCDE